MTKVPRNFDTMRFALSVQQPWAWAILHAGKDVENRTWKPPDDLVGRRLWLHAYAPQLQQCIEPEDIVPVGSRIELPRFDELPTGVILGSFLLLGTASSSLSHWYAPGAIAWRIAEPLPLRKPVRASGMQGMPIWPVPAEILTELST